MHHDDVEKDWGEFIQTFMASASLAEFGEICTPNLCWLQHFAVATPTLASLCSVHEYHYICGGDDE